jgi:hypothetical protein
LCSAYWINAVLDWFTTQGLAKQVTNQGPGTYQLLERFRVQVRELSGHAAFKALAVARRTDRGPDVTINPDAADLDPELSDGPGEDGGVPPGLMGAGEPDDRTGSTGGIA